MKASERARRFESDDRRERRMPWALYTDLNIWSAVLGIGAGVFCVLAWARADTTSWLLAAACAVGALLCWMLARSA